jgi:hypothetical protein
VYVAITLYAESAGTPSAVIVEIGPTSSPTQEVGRDYVYSTNSTVEQWGTSADFILPAGWYYEIHVAATGAEQSFSQVTETVL